ncbi:hypothetical protein ACIA5D_27240 [Actinoplanes sp. NPDC051513]|uniref:hypothetical protein n=1 Tax=Actinoplanes sp. NPDC051513 TaxID=3363908 RepID=UPI0037A42EE4
MDATPAPAPARTSRTDGKPTKNANTKLIYARLRMMSSSGSDEPMSRQEFAEAVNAWQWEHLKVRDHLDENDIGSYERGEHHWPRRPRRDGFRGVTGAVTDAELGFYRNRRSPLAGVAIPGPERSDHEDGLIVEPSNGVVRSALIKTAGTAPTLMLDDLDRMDGVWRDGHRCSDEELVAILTCKLADSAADDGFHGPRHALPTVLGIIATVQRKARSVDWETRRPLMRVGAGAAEFAGWLYRDMGHPVAADYWRDRASEWGLEATDYAMAGYVLIKKSQASWDNRDAARMLGLAEAAQDGPWRLPSRIMAEAVQQQARGLAMVNGNRQKVDDTLERARELLAQGAGDDGPLAAHYGEQLFRLQTAICYGESGRPDEAAEIYATTLKAEVFSTRDFAYFSVLQAQTLATIQQPDKAASIGCSAFSAATMAGSARTMQELARLRVNLHPWRKRPAVASFARLMETV